MELLTGGHLKKNKPDVGDVGTTFSKIRLSVTAMGKLGIKTTRLRSAISRVMVKIKRLSSGNGK